MSRGKYLSLEEARKSGKLDRFAKEHPSKGDRKRFGRLLDEMSKTTEEAEETSSPERGENSNGTRIRRGT
jgi:mRNA-degrading endonuclease RelE of RelBE toxin-antitoxin system